MFALAPTKKTSTQAESGYSVAVENGCMKIVLMILIWTMKLTDCAPFVNFIIVTSLLLFQ